MIEPVQGAFRALGDPTRRQILVHLADGELTIGELVDRFPMTRAAVKKHLTVLEEGRLITVRPRGRERVNRLEPEGLRVTAQWISTLQPLLGRPPGRSAGGHRARRTIDQ